jgi:adenylate kinase
MNSIVFVGGSHGAGKTTVSRLLAVELSASHVTAGALIREVASPAHTVTMGVGNKAVPDVDANQELLLRGLDLYRARIGSGPILLDGHFSLLNFDGVIVKVPAVIFEAIAPVAVLLVEADDSVVHERLIKRDGEAPSMTTISLLAESERACAKAISAHLRILMLIARGDAEPEAAAEAAASRLRAIIAGAA